MITEYTFPVGDNEVKLTIQGGQPMCAEDYESMMDFVKIFQKQSSRTIRPSNIESIIENSERRAKEIIDATSEMREHEKNAGRAK